ncbi:hypothetical protein FKM82_024527 [Ascaphus truei]
MTQYKAGAICKSGQPRATRSNMSVRAAGRDCTSEKQSNLTSLWNPLSETARQFKPNCVCSRLIR